jgi:1,4-dihydroxy-2-naphthoyl-CoA hydrolase
MRGPPASALETRFPVRGVHLAVRLLSAAMLQNTAVSIPERGTYSMAIVIWHHRPTLADLREMSRATAIEHFGIEFTEVGDDFLTARMPVDRRTIQPYGLLHGGSSVLLAETVGSAAAHCCVDEGAMLTVGIEINANHVRGVREGWVHGTARPLHLGRTTQLWEIRIVDDAARLVCISRLTIGVVARTAAR